MPQPQQHRIWAAYVTYTTAQGHAGSLTHWWRPGIELATSWFLVGFISAVPQLELQKSHIYVKEHHSPRSRGIQQRPLISNLWPPIPQASISSWSCKATSSWCTEFVYFLSEPNNGESKWVFNCRSLFPSSQMYYALVAEPLWKCAPRSTQAKKGASFGWMLLYKIHKGFLFLFY